ncbi:MAG: exonuclease subunit SbcD [Kiritimatiellae bacterium]|nr:exonuclease subunit SbcD [Kiritimatiellia bacterium]
MKIIHTSDWHLGARLHEEDRGEEHRAFLAWLLEQMRVERADALVVAGDIFDVKAPSLQAQGLYYGFLAEVVREQLCRKVVITAGNHDNGKFLAAPSELLEKLGIEVVSASGEPGSAADEVVTVEDEHGKTGLVIAAVPFLFDADLANEGDAGADAERNERVLAGWRHHYRAAIQAARAAAPDVPLVVTGHCTVKDAAPSDAESERCRRIGGIEAYDPAPFAEADYVALGHLHLPQTVKGFEGKMFYSGSPLRMSFDEAQGGKSVNIVTFGAAGEPPSVERRAVQETVPMVTLCGTPEAVKGKLAEYVAGGAAVKRFVRIQLKDFEGEAKGHWTEIRVLVRETQTLVLEENDIRPAVRETASLAVFAGRGIRQLNPREVAERKLRGSSRHFSEDEIADYLRMYDEVAGGVA